MKQGEALECKGNVQTMHNRPFKFSPFYIVTPFPVYGYPLLNQRLLEGAPTPHPKPVPPNTQPLEASEEGEEGAHIQPCFGTEWGPECLLMCLGFLRVRSLYL
jgi:hypothetical protein